MRPFIPVLACSVIVLAAVGQAAVADPPDGPPLPSQTHHSCIEHRGDEVPCLLFCTVCGHHDCSPDCPSRRPMDESAPGSVDCSQAAEAVEQARQIDLDRQAREQAAELQPHLRDWSKPSNDPEGDYWHLKGSDPRRPSLGQQMSEIGGAIRSVLGLDEDGAPDVDTDPLMRIPTRGWLPGLVGVLQTVHAALEVVGEIGLQRDRDYGLALIEAEADLQGQIDTLSAQATQFEELAKACDDLSASDKHLLQQAARDIEARQATLQARLDAIRASLDRVSDRLQQDREHSPSTPPQGSHSYNPRNLI
jgi:hypothetical protein